MGAEIKSVGFMIDELITTDLKCWFAQENIMDKSLSEHERLEAAIKAQQLNDRRNQLIRAIDIKLGDGENSPTVKTYHTYFDEKKK
jgi:hypothetical protein